MLSILVSEINEPSLAMNSTRRMLLNQYLGNQASAQLSIFSLFLISLPREPEADLCKCFPAIFSLKSNCVYTVGMAYVADWLGVHKCIVTNITNKKTAKPTQFLSGFFPCPWTLSSVLCPRHSKFLEQTLNRYVSGIVSATSLTFTFILYDALQKPHFYVFSEIQLSCNRKPFPKPSTCFSGMFCYPFSDICSLYTNGGNK